MSEYRILSLGLCQKRLEPILYRVYGVNNLASFDEEAALLEAIDKNDTQLVLINFNVSDVDQIVLCSKFASHKNLKNISLIASLAVGDTEVKSRILSAGALDVITADQSEKEIEQRFSRALSLCKTQKKQTKKLESAKKKNCI